MRKAFLAAALVTGSLWALEGPSLAQLTQSRPDQAGERRICRMMQVTGKIAAGRRVCLTRAEWDRAAEEQRKVAQRYLDTVNSCTAEGGAPDGNNPAAVSTDC